MQFETGDFRQRKEVEVEIHIDIGADGGEKIVSQSFRLHMPMSKPRDFSSQQLRGQI